MQAFCCRHLRQPWSEVERWSMATLLRRFRIACCFITEENVPIPTPDR